jgi:NADPH:quinone reductase-like Zn-dependent oxidoreductase
MPFGAAPMCVRAFTDGEGVDVVLEHVGTPVWAACFESLKPGGRFVTCGVTAGHRVEFRHLTPDLLLDLGPVHRPISPPKRNVLLVR